MDWAVLGPLLAEVGRGDVNTLQALLRTGRSSASSPSARPSCSSVGAQASSIQDHAVPDDAKERRHAELGRREEEQRRCHHLLRQHVDHVQRTVVRARSTLGDALFQQNCASCHGTEANGVPANGTTGAFPDLVGLGPATIDFWIDSGRMPAANTRAVEANRRVPRLDPDQALAIAAWVNSLSPSYPLHPESESEDRERL